jgi:hypothetical protein
MHISSATPLHLARPAGLLFLAFATAVSMLYPNLWNQPVRLNLRTALLYGTGLLVGIILMVTR